MIASTLSQAVADPVVTALLSALLALIGVEHGIGVYRKARNGGAAAPPPPAAVCRYETPANCGYERIDSERAVEVVAILREIRDNLRR